MHFICELDLNKAFFKKIDGINKTLDYCDHLAHLTTKHPKRLIFKCTLIYSMKGMNLDRGM